MRYGFGVRKVEAAGRNHTVQPGDTTFDHAEKTVLTIDEQVSELLANQKLVVDVTDDKPRLKLTEQRQE